MPTIILDRIPLPNLKIYTSVSVLLVSFCVYFAVNSTKDPDWRLLLNSSSVDGFVDAKLMDDESLIKLTNGELNSDVMSDDVIDRSVYVNILSDATPLTGNQTRSLGGQLKDVMDFMFQEPVCVWVSLILFCFFIVIRLVAIHSGCTCILGLGTILILVLLCRTKLYRCCQYCDLG